MLVSEAEIPKRTVTEESWPRDPGFLKDKHLHKFCSSIPLCVCLIGVFEHSPKWFATFCPSTSAFCNNVDVCLKRFGSLKLFARGMMPQKSKNVLEDTDSIQDTAVNYFASLLRSPISFMPLWVYID